MRNQRGISEVMRLQVVLHEALMRYNGVIHKDCIRTGTLFYFSFLEGQPFQTIPDIVVALSSRTCRTDWCKNTIQRLAIIEL